MFKELLNVNMTRRIFIYASLSYLTSHKKSAPCGGYTVILGSQRVSVVLQHLQGQQCFMMAHIGIRTDDPEDPIRICVLGFQDPLFSPTPNPSEAQISQSLFRPQLGTSTWLRKAFWSSTETSKRASGVIPLEDDEAQRGCGISSFGHPAAVNCSMLQEVSKPQESNESRCGFLSCWEGWLDLP